MPQIDAALLGDDPPGTPAPDATDRVAVARLRSGDIRGLDALYQRYAVTLLQLATRLLGSRQDAEDVVHDVFVSVFGAARTLREDTEVGAWLRTLAINRCIDRTRAAARHAAVASLLVPLPPATGDSSDVLAAERIERAISALPRTLRVVFVLRAIEGHSHTEIARTLGIRTGTSEVRYHRAVRALRVALGDLK